MRNAILFFLSALVLFAAGSMWILLYPSVPADLGGVENLDPIAKHVRIPVGEADHLDGWFIAGPRPATVILFAGYARDHRRVWRYAHVLRRAGYSVLAVDFRSARMLQRKPTTLGFWESLDARAALDWVRAQPSLRGQRVALFGESLGAAVALTLAAERPDVAAVVADCPFASADAGIADEMRLVGHLPAQVLAPIARQLGHWVTGQDPGALDATAALRALNGRPVLLIQTRMEDRFARAQVDRLTTAAGLAAETWTVEDAKHNEIWVVHREEYERRLARFMAAHLGGHAPPGDKPGLGKRGVKGARAGGHAVVEGTRSVGRAIARPFKKKPS